MSEWFKQLTNKGTNMSIDYGMGLVNIDHKTGIRYGVINANNVDYLWDSAEPHYSTCDCEFDDCMCEPSCWMIKDAGYHATISADDNDVFILKSPFFTLCEYCSPCAPGAGYLTSEGNVKAYCLGHEWFETGKCPYVVYSVESGEIVNPE